MSQLFQLLSLPDFTSIQALSTSIIYRFWRWTSENYLAKYTGKCLHIAVKIILNFIMLAKPAVDGRLNSSTELLLLKC